MSKVYIIVTPFFPAPNKWEGAYCCDFVKALRRLRPDLQVEVFVPGNGSDYEIVGVTVHRFTVWRFPSNMFPFAFRRRNELSFLKAIERAGIHLEDIVICHGHTANFAIYPLAIKRRNSNCKTLLHHHDMESFGLNLGCLRYVWLYNMLLFLQLRNLHEQIDMHVFISEACKRSFLLAPDASWTVNMGYKKQMRGLPFRSVRIKKAIILHNGVDTNLFSPLDRTKGNPHNIDNLFTIGCIANFIETKDQISLLKAILELRASRYGIRCIFIGSGPKLPECRAFVKTNSLDTSVHFLSEVRHEELAKFYQSLDLFVLPSYFEGFGCVLTEAYACGIPFITCEGQGMDDLIPPEERHLWLVKPKDPKELAGKIEIFIKYRRKQCLSGPITFDELLPPFLREITL